MKFSEDPLKGFSGCLRLSGDSLKYFEALWRSLGGPTKFFVNLSKVLWDSLGDSRVLWGYLGTHWNFLPAHRRPTGGPFTGLSGLTEGVGGGD
jgi:hypothetical protein